MKKSQQDVSRRDFMRGAARLAAGAGMGVAAARTAHAGVYKSILPRMCMGANERIRTGHIGVGGMGKRNLQFCGLLKDHIQPIAVCDLWEPHMRQAADIIGNDFPDPPSMHTYFEEVIENKDVDAVVIVTPDHWHALPTIMACEAGKDVYCEKPLATTVREGRAMVEAVTRNNAVLQCGNFQRSGRHFQEVVEIVQSGYIGKVARVETWIHDSEPIRGIGNPPDSDPPEGLDWDRYIGWTPKVPFNPNRFIYNFRWFLNYSGGKMTDWGAHLIDIVLWAMGEENAPRTVTATGGKFILEDNRTTPDTLEVLYQFDDYVLSFSNRVHNGFVWRNRYGIVFYGTLGTLYCDRGGYEVIPLRANNGCDPVKVEGVREMDMNMGHWQNFIECVHTREKPISHVASAHTTSTVCHAGTAAYVSGGHLEWDAGKQEFTGRPRDKVKEANSFLYRKYENGWSLNAPYYKGWA